MDTELLAQELERDEDLRLRPYRCTAEKLSIGVGRNLDDVGITEDEARYLLANDIRRTLADCETIPTFHRLSGVRQRVIANMVFNLGLGRFLGFRKMLAALEVCDWAEAAAQMLDSKWARQVGARAERLAEMMREGR
ncbi:glycoside hydrolase family protein [Microbulbifer sp. SAOS-129_SWC]|uniref:glycoside hydrolase family protein n=1 Tax=Microbulbifer sp. SAOS-129_SWC TaxID=3145235 RepID=UPI003217312A